eukprot:30185_1
MSLKTVSTSIFTTISIIIFHVVYSIKTVIPTGSNTQCTTTDPAGCSFECDTFDNCAVITLTCDPNHPCEVHCGEDGCQYSTIICPTDGVSGCEVNCNGHGACEFTVIQWAPPPTYENALFCLDQYACLGVNFPIPDPNVNLDIWCNIGTNTCEEAIINCPTNARCRIYCDGSDSCRAAVINWPTDPSVVTVLDCTGTNACTDTTPKPIIASNTEDYYLNCLESVCANRVIHCPLDYNCFITCDAVSACDNFKLYGPNNKEFAINCDQQYSCRNGIIHGENSNLFEMQGCVTGTRACTGMQIWVSWNNGGEFIGVDNSFSGKGGVDLHIYAQNGFNDVTFTSYGGDYSGNFGFMHCGAGYANQCKMAVINAWRCDAGDNTYCDITLPPTTAAPTTSNPSTFNPTTF